MSLLDKYECPKCFKLTDWVGEAARRDPYRARLACNCEEEKEMVYGVTGWNNNGAVGRCELVMFDTEEEAKAEAESWVKKGVKDVVVWKQIAAPKLKTEILWEDGL